MTVKPGQREYVVAARHPRYAARGQALIMAILIMFLLVGLCGLFIAMLNHAMVQTARAADRLRLEEIALAGLSQAQTQLRTSTEGADWRPGLGPDTRNRGWIALGGGFYKITVHYGPSNVTPPTTATPPSPGSFFANPLEHMLRVDVVASYYLPNQPQLAADDQEAPAYNNGYQNGQRFLRRTITSLQPIGITDYARWETNYDNSPTPILLGDALTLNELNTGPPNLTGNFYSVIDGPLRCEGDAQIGNLALYLTNTNAGSADASAYSTNFNVTRNDQVTITGNVAPLLPGVSSDILLTHTASALSAVAPATVFSLAGSVLNPANAAYDPTTSNYIQCLANNPPLRPLQAPPIDARDRNSGLDRYRALTRDSGQWNGAAFTGLTGDGTGLYINNVNDIQYNGNQAQMMTEWLDPTQPHWTNGVYQPQMTDANGAAPSATELVLHDWGAPQPAINPTTGNPNPDPGARALPYLELRSYSAPFSGTGASTTTLNGYYYKILPYPRNGVVFAEGNLVVMAATPDGVNETCAGLPASLAYPPVVVNGQTLASPTPLQDGNGNEQAPGGWNATPSTRAWPIFTPYGNEQAPGGWNATSSTTSNIQYYVNDANRRFDLTIVSGGTIYIQGNILGPASRQATYLNTAGVATPITSGSNWDSKLALLAMDNVVLNPTTMMQVVSNPPDDLGTEKAWRVTHDAPLTVQFTTSGSAATAGFVLRDTGDGNSVLPGDPAYTVMKMTVNGSSYPWSANPFAANLYYFGSVPVMQDYFPNIFMNWPAQWCTNMYPGPFNVHAVSAASMLAAGLPIQGYGATNTVQFSLDPSSKAHYLVDAGNSTIGPGFILTGVNLQVDALVYAQRGSWYVIPGSYQNNMTPITGSATSEATNIVTFAAGVPTGVVAGMYCTQSGDPTTYMVSTVSTDGSNTVIVTPSLNITTTPVLWTFSQFQPPYPQYQEPYDLHIVINGAIVENRPAPLSAEEQSQLHWRGPNSSYQAGLDPANGGWTTAQGQWQWATRRAGIEYHYDATLAVPVCYTTVSDIDGSTSLEYFPRLPKLPVSPSALSFGQMSGA